MNYSSLNFALGETIDMLREQVQAFVAAEIAPRAEAIDQENLFPADMWRKFGEMGLLGVTVSEEYGGAGLGYRPCGRDGRDQPRLGLGGPVLRRAFEPVRQPDQPQRQRRAEGPLPAQADQWRARRRAGHERTNAGSDVVSMKLRAEKRGDRYVLNGSKTDHQRPGRQHLRDLRQDRLDKGPHGITAFIVERDWKGFSRGNKFDKLGMRGSNTCELFFDDVEVPEENVLGVENGGVKVLMSGLDYERVVLAGGPTGIMQACLDVVVPYIHDRKQFGQSIGEFQFIQGKVADMYTQLNASRAYLYAVAQACDRGETTRKDAAGVILYTAENATQMALQAIRSSAAMATSTNSPPAACCATPSSTRSAPAPAKSAAC